MVCQFVERCASMGFMALMGAGRGVEVGVADGADSVLERIGDGVVQFDGLAARLVAGVQAAGPPLGGDGSEVEGDGVGDRVEVARRHEQVLERVHLRAGERP